jgi:hypothetical protein
MESNRSGRGVANQFIITDDEGNETFQSYRTIIATNKCGNITLDVNSWDYSKTTGKYRNIFLGENKAETERKIKSGEYKLEDLNK